MNIKKNSIISFEEKDILSDLDFKMISGSFTEEDKKEYVNLMEKINQAISNYLMYASLKTNTMNRNGFTDKGSRLNKLKENVQDRFSGSFITIINAKKSSFEMQKNEFLKKARRAKSNNNINIYQPSETNIIVENTAPIKFKKDDDGFLLQYLKDVFTLEKEIYCSQRAIERAEEKVRILEPAKSEFSTPVAPKKTFWNSLFGGYEEKEKAYKGELEALERKNQRIQRYKDVKIPLYKNISSCTQTLEKMYHMDIIHFKYRNLVAVAQLYEYIETGRASTLEGHEGAYNIYEHELRQNMIIDRLDRISEQLEEIAANQSKIYSAICESNMLLGQIANNTAITAYNTSVMANNNVVYARYY